MFHKLIMPKESQTFRRDYPWYTLEKRPATLSNSPPQCDRIIDPNAVAAVQKSHVTLLVFAVLFGVDAHWRWGEAGSTVLIAGAEASTDMVRV